MDDLLLRSRALLLVDVESSDDFNSSVKSLLSLSATSALLRSSLDRSSLIGFLCSNFYEREYVSIVDDMNLINNYADLIVEKARSRVNGELVAVNGSRVSRKLICTIISRVHMSYMEKCDESGRKRNPDNVLLM